MDVSGSGRKLPRKKSAPKASKGLGKKDTVAKKVAKQSTKPKAALTRGKHPQMQSSASILLRKVRVLSRDEKKLPKALRDQLKALTEQDWKTLDERFSSEVRETVQALLESGSKKEGLQLLDAALAQMLDFEHPDNFDPKGRAYTSDTGRKFQYRNAYLMINSAFESAFNTGDSDLILQLSEKLKEHADLAKAIEKLPKHEDLLNFGLHLLSEGLGDDPFMRFPKAPVASLTDMAKFNNHIEHHIDALLLKNPKDLRLLEAKMHVAEASLTMDEQVSPLSERAHQIRSKTFRRFMMQLFTAAEADYRTKLKMLETAFKAGVPYATDLALRDANALLSPSADPRPNPRIALEYAKLILKYGNPQGLPLLAEVYDVLKNGLHTRGGDEVLKPDPRAAKIAAEALEVASSNFLSLDAKNLQDFFHANTLHGLHTFSASMKALFQFKLQYADSSKELSLDSILTKLTPLQSQVNKALRCMPSSELKKRYTQAKKLASDGAFEQAANLLQQNVQHRHGSSKRLLKKIVAEAYASPPPENKKMAQQMEAMLLLALA